MKNPLTICLQMLFLTILLIALANKASTKTFSLRPERRVVQVIYSAENTQMPNYQLIPSSLE